MNYSPKDTPQSPSDGKSCGSVSKAALHTRKSIQRLFNVIKEVDDTFCPDHQLVIDDNLSIEQIWAQLRPSVNACSLESQSNGSSVNTRQHSSNSGIHASEQKNSILEARERELISPRTAVFPENMVTSQSQEIDKECSSDDLDDRGIFPPDKESCATTSSNEGLSDVEHSPSSDPLKDQECEIMADKPWNLRGEATARQRDPNSLLEHDFDMDYALKTVPVASEQSTKSLEDTIRERIKTETFDDPQRKHHFSCPRDIVRSNSADTEGAKRKSLVDLYHHSKSGEAESRDSNSTQEASDELKCLRMWRDIKAYLDSLSSCSVTCNPFVENLRE